MGYCSSYVRCILLVYPMKYAHFRNILPIFTHSPFDMLISAKHSALEFLGFETILIFYPFIEKGKSLKDGPMLELLLLLIYVVLAIVSFMYYRGTIKPYYLAYFNDVKIIKVPLFSALNILLFSFGFNYFTNLCLTIWSSCQTMKRSFHISFKFTLPFLFSSYFQLLYFSQTVKVSTH